MNEAMPIRVLLVDDEAVDLEWLRRRVAGSGLPVQVAGTASSGFAALDLLQREQVDVILTDIRMPIMSGIEFARRAKEARPHVKIVFISGHEDFHYAKEALRLSASGYLLKPVDDEELLAMLGTLCRDVEQEKRASRSVSEALSLAARELLLRWLGGDRSPLLEEHLQPYLLPAAEHGASCALIEIDDLEWKAAALGEAERDRHIAAMGAFLHDFAERRQLGLMLAGLPGARAVLIARAGADPRLEELVAELARRFPLTVTIGVGRPAGRWQELPESYREAQAALSAKWLLGKNRVLRESPEPLGDEGPSAAQEAVIDRMLAAILQYDLVEIDDCLLELFGGSGRLRRSEAYPLVLRLTSKLHADLQAMDENLYELLKWDTHEPGVMFQFETMNDLLSWLRKRLFELSELLLIKSRRHSRKLIDEIKAYVEERLEQKVTLKETAAQFSFTPNYLGHLFKEETGQHFSDYLLERKLKLTCSLLEEPTLKIYEIADRMGYKNIVYFNRQFKQATGMSPGEYRKKAGI